MGPLFYLLKKQTPFQWKKEQQKVFKKAKSKLTTILLLVQYNPKKETTIKTNASDYVIGARIT
jgi:hypothetical protein